MNKLKVFCAILIMVSAISAPGSEENISTESIIQEAKEILPSDPGVFGDETLEGVDSDRDGVRDDIEVYIAREFSTDVGTGDDLIWIAYNLQKTITERYNSKVQDFWRKSTQGSVACLQDRLPGESFRSIRKRLWAQFYNTDERWNELINLSRAMSGSTIALRGCNR